jgi:protein ImuA
MAHVGPPAAERLKEVRRQVRAIERGGALVEGGLEKGHDAFRLGVPALDDALPWGGLARAALHEIADRSVDGAGLGFASALLVRLLRARATEDHGESSVLWCIRAHREHDTGALYGPGFAAFGLDPSRLILVHVKRAADVLWVMREGLSNRNIAAVVGEGAAADLNDSRRLQLAAEANGTTAFLLRPSTTKAAPSAALTRWSVEAAPSGPVLPDLPADLVNVRSLGPGPARWNLQLERCRGGVPKDWHVEWHPETGLFAPIHAAPTLTEADQVEPAPAPSLRLTA